ncbi:MAG TPA: hypothetical protein DD671_16900 [Balneolaceae bacterium]|nr:hypothetical protein [Balneola sp.]HBQ61242.1 hypothetical protein [Balneolaceae bacterium]|tara:strand:- start:196 stop:399 length:204 start_codon:yes stop_codon:yes gene_type:complete
MKETIGGILTAGGLLGVIYYGYKYFQDSESFEAFGADVAVSTGDYTPIIISGVVMIVGIVITKLNFK